MTFEFKKLPYGYDALEPHIDAKTMETHYSKHHKTYFDKFSAAVEGTDMSSKTLTDILKTFNPEKHAAIRNNGGGCYNHDLFWTCMAPNGSRTPSGTLGAAIDTVFGSYDNLKSSMSNAGIGRFGSGFVWLILNGDKKLEVTSTPNQDNPLMSVAGTRGTPIFCIDVWEHAYYLKYQNRRPDYLNGFWNVASWGAAEARFQSA